MDTTNTKFDGDEFEGSLVLLLQAHIKDNQKFYNMDYRPSFLVLGIDLLEKLEAFRQIKYSEYELQRTQGTWHGIPLLSDSDNKNRIEFLKSL